MSEMLDDKKETIFLSDINLNTLSFDKSNEVKTPYEKSLTPMYEKFKEFISKYKLIHLNNVAPTRKNTILDVIYTNKPEKNENKSP